MKDAMRLIESDRETWGQFLELLQAYDDCIRTRGGVRFRKRSQWMADGNLTFDDSLQDVLKIFLTKQLMKLQDGGVKNINDQLDQSKYHSNAM